MNAPSTVLVSAYNLVVFAGPGTEANLLALFEINNFEATPAQLSEAIAFGVQRGMLEVVDGVVHALGEKGWVITERDNDPDGWSGWIATNLKTRERRAFSELMSEKEI